MVMEEIPHFNAGYGAALTEDGEHELDASIMDGATLGAGAVCAVRTIRNPIRAARAVMDKSDCVLLAGAAADAFAKRAGLDDRAERLFHHRPPPAGPGLAEGARGPRHHRTRLAKRSGTARSARWRWTGTATSRQPPRPAASTTSRRGASATRRSSAPAPTRATACALCRAPARARSSCAASSAYDVAARMSYAGQTLEQATDALVFDVLPSHKIGAGLVAIDAAGRVRRAVQHAGHGARLGRHGWRGERRDAPGRLSRGGRVTRNTQEPILIWGAGAIGGTLGAYWARAGVPVLLVDIVAEHVRGLPHHRAGDRRTGRGVHAGRAGRRRRTSCAARTRASSSP